MYRKYINIVEAANKGCPIATHDIDINLKNRQKAIDEYHYGPANPDSQCPEIQYLSKQI